MSDLKSIMGIDDEDLEDLDEDELPIIVRTYGFIVWFVPILNHLPREHKFNLGDRIINHLIC